MSSPTADVSVRVAWADDAPGIAAVQLRSWRAAYVDLLPAELLEAIPVEDVSATWAESLKKPKDARNRVLVALERNRITGFAITAPAGDPDCNPLEDGEVGEFCIDPDEQRLGHGSRLLQACADTLRADRFVRAVFWVSSTDDAGRGFFEGAGWAPDTAHRELDLHGDGAVRVKQVRLHTAL